MSRTERSVVEANITKLLMDQWDPLSVRETPGTHEEYAKYAHDLFNLLARGSSDMQLARFLHRAERDELNHPELVERDLSPLVRALREVEATI